MNAEETTYDFKKLKTFHIPRKKEQQSNKDILSDLPTQSREFTHTLYPVIKSSFLYPHSSRRIKIEKVELVHNPVLQKEFLEKKKDLKDEGRTEKELVESLGYLYVKERAEVEKICENGIEIGNTSFVSLGKPLMGVYVCKHADVVSATNFSNTDNGYIVVFKIIKGKTKVVTECRSTSTNQEPTPLFDCHVTKLTTDPSKTSHIRAFQALQYYIYEYGDVDVLKRPRQIVPHAVLHIKYSELDNTLHRKESVSSNDGALETVLPSQSSKLTSLDQEAFALWKGKLLVKGGLFCTVKLLSDVDAAVNVAFLDKHINVKNLMSIDKFARQLPSTLLNKEGKKHNVIYRGRNYNIFTLMPEDDSGMGKFRQLIAHLVQRNGVATIPLHYSSCLYLLPKCQLTEDRMGLKPFENDLVPKRNQFLYAVIVTPKSLTSKVNDRKLHNMIHLRKSKETRSDIPEELEQKLVQLNIDSSLIGSLNSEQLKKLTGILKDKKRLQMSEKLLHHHYKDVDRLLMSSKDHNKFSGKVGSLWSTTCQLREDYYAPKPKKKPVAKMEKPAKVVPVVEEATFSDEDGGDVEIPPVVVKPSPALPSNDPRSRSHSQDGALRAEKRKISSDSTIKEPVVPSKLVRPSFKPLEEILCKSETNELLLHPDFVLSERYTKTHVVVKERGFGVEPDLERSDQISIVIRQNVPFSSDRDCPYACDGNPVIKSMLRAVYGPWEGDGDANLMEDREKVLWVRQILHLNKNRSSSETMMFSGRMQDRKIVEDGIMSIQESSPFSAPGGSSSDSGFTSSSTTATPTTSTDHLPNSKASAIQAGNPVSSPTALREIASFLASALPKTTDESDEAQITAQNLLKVLAKTVDKGENGTPNLKAVMDTVVEQQRKQESQSNMPLDGSPMEMGTPSPSDSDHHNDQHGNLKNSKPSRSQSFDRPQDPRLSRRTALSHRHLSLPTYHFPPSKIASIHLPIDAEVTLTRPHPISKPPTTSSSGPRNMMINTPPKDPYKALKPVKDFGMNEEKKMKGFRPMRGATFSLHKVLKAPLFRSFPNLMVGPKVTHQTVIRSTGVTGTPHPQDGTRIGQAPRSLDHPSETRHTIVSPQIPTSGAESTQTSEKWKSDNIAPHITIPAPLSAPSSHIQVKAPGTVTLNEAGNHLSKSDLINILQHIGRSNTPLPNSSTLTPTKDPYCTGLARPQEGPQDISKTSGSVEIGSDPPREKETFAIQTVTAKTLSSNNFTSSDATSSSINVSHSASVAPSGAALSDAKLVTQTSVSANLISVTSVPAICSQTSSVASSVSNTVTKNTERSIECSTSQSASSSSSNSPAEVATPTPMMSREDIIRIREKMKRAKQKKKEAVKQSKIEKRLQDPETSKKKAENEEVSSKKPSCASSEENSKTIDNNAEELSQQKQSVETVKSVKQTPDSEASTQPVTSPTANDPTSNSNINPSQDQETNDKNQDGVVVLSEIDKILSEVKRNKSVNTTEALSDRLLQLALQLRNTNSPITTSSANTTPAVVNTEKEGPKIVSKVNPVTDVTGASSAPNIEQLTSTNPQNSGPVVSIGLDNSVEQQSISSAAKTAQPNSLELEIASTVTAVATNVVDINTQIDYAQQVTVVNPLAQGILVASVQPIMSVKPLQGMELDTIQAQTLTDTEPAVIETDATRDTATPTQDDTYNPLQETMLQDSFRKTYPNFRGLSEVCKQHIGHSRNATSALQSIMQEADTLEERVQFPPKTPLTATDHIQALQTTSNLPNQQSNTTERLLPTNNSINLPKKQSSVQVRPQGLAHLEKMGPPFYVFDPRGDPNCDAIVTYLRRINGVPYHLHRVTEVLAAQRKNYLIGIKGMIGITDDILNCSLPAGRLWIVIRSADLSLLPSMPYLSMLKCAGPRVQFVQADTLDEVKSRRYHHIMSGEHGIILPVSANVIIDNPVVFTKIVNWMVQTRNDQVGEGKPLKNTWRLALYNHILEDLQATSDTRFGSELGQKAASSLIQLLKENSGIVVNLFARDQYSGNVSESDIVETAMELQLENLRHTRHVVVLTGHDQESPQWRRLRRAGVAVTTLDQFVQSIKQAKHNENPCQYSPLMRIYSTEIA